MVPLKHWSKFRRTFEVPLINCEIGLMLTCSKNYFLVAGTAVNREPTFTVTDIKFYVPVVTLSTQDNVKLLKQLESGFKWIINWNKYQSKITEQTWNRYLDFLIDPSFRGLNKLFVLLFENRTVRESC